MQKRKLKLNIIDVVIFVVIACSVAALIFRDTITNVFGKPEIVPLEIMISGDTIEETDELFFNSGSIMEVNLGNNAKVQAVLIDAEFPNNKDASVRLTLNGYEKFGKFFTDSGYQIEIGEDCVIQVNASKLVFEVDNVGYFNQNEE